jgi:curved DNA-binding protein CbpA
MTLQEVLSSNEAKEAFRTLSKRFHPDLKGGSEQIMKDINNAKDKGDKELLALFRKLIKRNEDTKDDSYDNINARRGSDKRKMLYYSNIAEKLQNAAAAPGLRIFISTRRDGSKFHYSIVIGYKGKTFNATIFDLDKYKSEKEIRTAVLEKIMKMI